MSAGAWVGAACLYVPVGVMVAMLIVAIEDMFDAPARLFVGLAVFWPLAVAATLFRCAREVWKWGFGRKEK